MSIQVENVVKMYGAQEALKNVSFEISQGSIVGFLGPNGAGKSTMMKIISCYIPQTSGSVKVSGFDVTTQAEEVKKRLGYLPEHNPLYLNMYVKEYLEFVAGIHKVSSMRERVNSIIKQVGLTREQHKQINALSKGYRQRVGIAQALIHDPEVLILDEPTSGLDPNQIIEIRDLIKSIGHNKTVMLSTHIMQEVEAVCDRAIIIHKGALVADKKIDELRSFKGQQVIKVEFDQKVEHNMLTKLPGALNASHLGNNVFRISSASKEDIRPAIFDFAVKQKVTVLTIQKEEQRLEEIFKSLTKG